MSNSTGFVEVNGEINYIAICGWALFFVSEIMPFLKKKESFNGMIHTLVCLLKGSKCFAEKALNVLDKSMKFPQASFSYCLVKRLRCCVVCIGLPSASTAVVGKASSSPYQVKVN